MSNDSPIPILVTGGAGYVGAHACYVLAVEIAFVASGTWDQRIAGSLGQFSDKDKSGVKRLNIMASVDK